MFGRILIRALLFVASLGAIALPSYAEKRVALVVGNAAYQNAPPLPNAHNDAIAVAAALKAARFDVVEVRSDLGISALRRAVSDFADVAADSDIAVIYYAGHGIEVDGTNYLVPTDAKLARDFDVEDEAFSLDRAVRAIDPARHLRLVILDACRENPFVRTMKRSTASRSIGRGLAKAEPTVADTLIAFSAKAGSIALDGQGQNSPFTSALVRHITTPGLDVRIAFGRVRDDVLAATGRRQEPFVYGSLGGRTIALVEAPATVPTQHGTSASARSLHGSLLSLVALAVPSSTPSVNERVVGDYEKRQGHKALAVAPSKGTWQRGKSEGANTAEEETLEACQVFYGQPCAVVAVDDKVFVESSRGNWQLNDMARVRYTGTFDPERVPVIGRWLINDANTANFIASTGPKAAVFHPWGHVYYQWDALDQKTAERQAFARCEADPQRNGAEPPCYLYAAGNQVVLTKRQSKPTQ